MKDPKSFFSVAAAILALVVIVIVLIQVLRVPFSFH
jgi:hypothetical protein